MDCITKRGEFASLFYFEGMGTVEGAIFNSVIQQGAFASLFTLMIFIVETISFYLN